MEFIVYWVGMGIIAFYTVAMLGVVLFVDDDYEPFL